MGISRLESIIRNSIKTENETSSTTSINDNGIYNICLKDLPHLPNSRKYPHIRTVVIDTSEFIYKSIIGGDHTSGILNFLEKMFRCQLMPIFVFDGKPPKEKNRIIEERKKAKARARAKVISLNDKLEIADELLNIVENKFGGSPSNKNGAVDTFEDNIQSNILSENEQFDSQPTINFQKIYDILGDTAENNKSSDDGILTSNEVINEDIIDRLRLKISDMITETEKIGKKMVKI